MDKCTKKIICNLYFLNLKTKTNQNGKKNQKTFPKEVWWAYALIPFVILYKSGYWDTPEEIAAQKEIERVEAAKRGKNEII